MGDIFWGEAGYWMIGIRNFLSTYRVLLISLIINDGDAYGKVIKYIMSVLERIVYAPSTPCFFGS
jgi:hypothetical protein